MRELVVELPIGPRTGRSYAVTPRTLLGTLVRTKAIVPLASRQVSAAAQLTLSFIQLTMV